MSVTRQQPTVKRTTANKTAQGKKGQKQQRHILIELFDLLPTRLKGVTFGLLIALLPSYLVSANAIGDQKALAIVPLLGLILSGYIVGILIDNIANSESES